MYKNYKTLIYLIPAIALMIPSYSLAGVVVIGNKSIVTSKLTTKQARKIWLGRTKALPGSGKIVVVDQPPDSTSHTDFYSKTVKKNAKQLRTYWSKRVFTGRGSPPKQLADDAAVKKWVADTPNALGYIDSSAVDSSVKVLLRVQ